MAWKQLVVTLSGNTQVTANRIPVKHVKIYNPAGNADVLIGDSNLSATAFAGHLDADDPPYEIGPFSGEAPLSLSEVYVRGTDAEKVHIGYITH